VWGCRSNRAFGSRWLCCPLHSFLSEGLLAVVGNPSCLICACTVLARTRKLTWFAHLTVLQRSPAGASRLNSHFFDACHRMPDRSWASRFDRHATTRTPHTRAGNIVTILSSVPVRALFVGLPLSILLIAATPAPGQAKSPPRCVPAEQCCRRCDDGKACGDSCISRRFNCHKGRGCACNIDEICPDTNEKR
jgi:hypothetical protein